MMCQHVAITACCLDDPFADVIKDRDERHNPHRALAELREPVWIQLTQQQFERLEAAQVEALEEKSQEETRKKGLSDINTSLGLHPSLCYKFVELPLLIE